MIELWKDVIDYSGIYDVSDFGRVRSLDRVLCNDHKLKGRIRKLQPNKHRYVQVMLCFEGKIKNRYVHQLVCEAFIGPCPEGMEVRHGPNGRSDNSISNLSYGTRSQNELDKRRDGTSAINKSKRIPVVCSDGREFVSGREAARVTECHQSNITACCKGKLKTAGGFTWKYKKEL